MPMTSAAQTPARQPRRPRACCIIFPYLSLSEFFRPLGRWRLRWYSRNDGTLGEKEAKGPSGGICDAVLGVLACAIVRQLLDPLV
jgi:hypothetical protein